MKHVLNLTMEKKQCIQGFVNIACLHWQAAVSGCMKRFVSIYLYRSETKSWVCCLNVFILIPIKLDALVSWNFGDQAK